MDELAAALIAEMLAELDSAFVGPIKSIYCYLPTIGGCPSREFLDNQSMQVQAVYTRLFKRICDGHNLRGDRWHPWDEDDGKGCKGLYDYKDNSSQTRIIHLVEKNIHVLLFGFGGKKENKIAKGHITRALEMKREYLERRTAVEIDLRKRNMEYAKKGGKK